MAENINFNKSVFNKRNYNKIIDTSFKELGVKTIQEQLDEQPTVQEFFDMYNVLFYNIPQLGPTLSHEYLVKTSKEYIGFEEDNELITLLQAEITNLRTQVLDSQQQLATFASLIPNAPEITIPNINLPQDGDEDNDLESQLNDIPTPETPDTTETPDKEERVVNDFSKYPKSTIKKRSTRLGLSKSYIKAIKKDYDL
jgi:hypothetical protein|tara:strand:- start:1545 stop:2138 length:594 start_codon:yes stop_codon:yes gene_type:complete